MLIRIKKLRIFVVIESMLERCGIVEKCSEGSRRVHSALMYEHVYLNDVCEQRDDILNDEFGRK